MIELKQCPFCGGKAEVFDQYQTKFAKGFFVVECQRCNAMICDFDEKHCMNDAIKQWNMRAYAVSNGHWEIDEETGEYVCSECGHSTCGYFDLEDEAFECEHGIGFRLIHPRYCKHCGAKMNNEEGENNEN